MLLFNHWRFLMKLMKCWTCGFIDDTRQNSASRKTDWPIVFADATPKEVAETAEHVQPDPKSQGSQPRPVCHSIHCMTAMRPRQIKQQFCRLIDLMQNPKLCSGRILPSQANESPTKSSGWKDLKAPAYAAGHFHLRPSQARF